MSISHGSYRKNTISEVMAIQCLYEPILDDSGSTLGPLGNYFECFWRPPGVLIRIILGPFSGIVVAIHLYMLGR